MVYQTPISNVGIESVVGFFFFFPHSGVRDDWGLAKINKELDPALCLPLEGTAMGGGRGFKK